MTDQLRYADLETLALIRVLSRLETIRMVCLTPRTWAKLEARGDTPPKTRLSERRIGYRVSDIKDWLDKRREVPGCRGTFIEVAPSSRSSPADRSPEHRTGPVNKDRVRGNG